MLIIALVLAVIGLAALVFAVVTSNEVVAWLCIGASVLGVVLLIVDALQERQARAAGPVGQQPSAPPHADDAGAEAATSAVEGDTQQAVDADYPEDTPDADVADAEGISLSDVGEHSGVPADHGRSDADDSTG
ncbi:cytochrome d ubiquinol oxidase subunit II [Mycobacterium botniense]|uniref:Transmembrane protein n=1 Tax=Mycobacterium botniense TaxID=84962 RepID=A0A7I9Y0J5_9MYCO|nr:cytochrome d ubiquinol oxidase subunit II [Mycobacterium botniense]GFG75588.1 hypothetical protein MBOT_29530 [Mycobacterium botniense]